MKILIANDGPCAFYYIRLGLARAFNACGHEVFLWEINEVPANDMFDRFNPDIFIGQTYNLNRSTINAIKERPHMKVIMKASDWGSLVDNIDTTKYPILTANEKEIKNILDLHEETGKPDFVHIHYHSDYIDGTHGYWKQHGIKIESILNASDIFEYINGVKVKELESDLCFVGGYWGYKSQTFNKWLIPLCNEYKFKIKIFGNQAWPVPQYCGFIPNEMVKNAFSSAKVCANLSEPHSQVFGFDIIERPFKLLSNKCFVISDYVAGLKDIIPDGIVYANTPKEFYDYIDYFLQNPEKKEEFIQNGYNSVIDNHTYFHRAAQIFGSLNLMQHSQHCLNVYNNVRKQL
jgi:hypothetical protein